VRWIKCISWASAQCPSQGIASASPHGAAPASNQGQNHRHQSLRLARDYACCAAARGCACPGRMPLPCGVAASGHYATVPDTPDRWPESEGHAAAEGEDSGGAGALRGVPAFLLGAALLQTWHQAGH